MSRISVILGLSGILAALTFSANVASAGSVAVHTPTPNVKIQTPHTNIGSQSSGAGAGKVTFNPFKITKTTDKASPTFYKQMSNGKHTTGKSDRTLYDDKQKGGDEKPKESVSFSYDKIEW